MNQSANLQSANNMIQSSCCQKYIYQLKQSCEVAVVNRITRAISDGACFQMAAIK
ncbi:hypothetical protein TTHERM_00161450 (macronuclear) [Tetrahymena thermophila SB210]|uniref:Uncharacterized protein n=1 Tax=Tetrahymena thermophila (strain SB210) TaxID=312017 RepID=Q22VY9_TETTS|nr:hypothetical protein TTHERM_00161450 [Tetrahymena thermophila SB210]EAR89627.1 hypothetical protein TTHERM_00161450 [Tetrahymena thermophila SB210]|eukprot:XP_001009873.1 hypothetical protein TTHERM_00161450 [Tetrahymena thermophila SB210]